MPKTRVYDDAILVRPTKAEGRTIRQRARAARRSLSRFLAELGTQGADLPAPVPPTPLAVASGDDPTAERDRALLYHLRRVGQNLNRLVIVANKGTIPNLGELHRALAEVEALTRRIAEERR